MGSRILPLALLLLFAQNIQSQPVVFDITKYGAKPDGITDMTQAFLDAWNDVCASTKPSTLLIPKGTFAMNAVKIEGKTCKAPIEFKLVGTLKAPSKAADMNGADGWINLNHVDQMTMTGGGIFDGNGAESWVKNDCETIKTKSKNLPINIRFNFVTNSLVTKITSKDSKKFHINVLGGKNLTFDGVFISAPETSINTDGIHISRSAEDITVINSLIQTGDDCISIGDGVKNLNFEKVRCGPGHGFAVGSLGRSGPEANVTGVTFKNCTLTGTTNGVRIKTWPSSPPDYSMTISDITFDDIVMNNVSNPVVIDQEYCPHDACDKKKPSRVKISGVRIKNLRGTFSSLSAVKLQCSPGFPCNKVEIGDINLKYLGKNRAITSPCDNVKPTLVGKQNLPICSSKSSN